MDTHFCCPICASADFEPVTLTPTADEATPTVVRCASCRFLYRRVGAAATKTARDARVPSPAPAAGKVTSPDTMIRQRLTIVENAVGRGALLDIGCHDGRFLHLAQQTGWHVAGITSTFGADELHPKLPNIPLYDTLEEGLWPAGSFDAITLWELPSPSMRSLELFSLAAYYCRLDGVLVVQVWNGEVQTDWGAGATGSSMPEYTVYLSSPALLDRLLGRFGFRVERLERAHVPVTPPVEHSRIFLPTLFPRRQSSNLKVTTVTDRRQLARAHRGGALILTARYVP